MTDDKHDDWMDDFRKAVNKHGEQTVSSWLSQLDRVVEEGLRIAEKHNLLDSAAVKAVRDTQPVLRDTVEFVAGTIKGAVDSAVGPFSPVEPSKTAAADSAEPESPIAFTVLHVEIADLKKRLVQANALRILAEGHLKRELLAVGHLKRELAREDGLRKLAEGQVAQFRVEAEARDDVIRELRQDNERLRNELDGYESLLARHAR